MLPWLIAVAFQGNKMQAATATALKSQLLVSINGISTLNLILKISNLANTQINLMQFLGQLTKHR